MPAINNDPMRYRQYDIPLTTQYHYSIPTSVKGRITTQDFLYFSFQCNLNPDAYDVCCESFSGELRKIGSLAEAVRLPHVHIAPESLLWLLPKTNPSLPSFVGTVERGKTYIVSTVQPVIGSINCFLLR